jgi:lysophospholipase L1-like esterase
MRSTNVLTAIVVAITVASCGGGHGTQGGGTRVVSLGDSITAGAPLWDPDKASRDALGTSADERSQYEYWAQRRLDGTRFRNCGVSGERTDEIASRLDECVRGAQVLIVQGGANDIAQGGSVEKAAANLRAMVRRGKQRGQRVAITELVPWNGGYPAAAPSIRRLNGLIGRIGEDEDVPVFAWSRAVEDPAKPGRMRANYVSADQIHPTVAGYRRLAEEVELP